MSPVIWEVEVNGVVGGGAGGAAWGGAEGAKWGGGGRGIAVAGCVAGVECAAVCGASEDFLVLPCFDPE